MKQRLNDYFEVNRTKNKEIGLHLSRRNSMTETSNKKTDQFRISTFRASQKHRSNSGSWRDEQRQKQTLQNRHIQLINNEFKVKQISIKPRESINDPRVYQRLGFNRAFLKYHGENKCFEKALKFKDDHR